MNSPSSSRGAGFHDDGGGRRARAFPKNPRPFCRAAAAVGAVARRAGRAARRAQMELLCNGASGPLLEILRAHHAEDVRCEALSLEEIFVASKTLSPAKP